MKPLSGIPQNRLSGLSGLAGLSEAGRMAAPSSPGPGDTYAALARRILRRRSEARSSSFRPPQVPYFSGRETA